MSNSWEDSLFGPGTQNPLPHRMGRDDSIAAPNDAMTRRAMFDRVREYGLGNNLEGFTAALARAGGNPREMADWITATYNPQTFAALFGRSMDQQDFVNLVTRLRSSQETLPPEQPLDLWGPPR